MSKPTEYKTVQARILAYAQEARWTFVSREEAEKRSGVEGMKAEGGRRKAEGGRMRGGSLFVDERPDAKVREFSSRYT